MPKGKVPKLWGGCFSFFVKCGAQKRRNFADKTKGEVYEPTIIASLIIISGVYLANAKRKKT